MPLTSFRPSIHGFPFPNAFPRGTPVVRVGRFGLGDAAAGLCGGMAFAALDYFLLGQPRPPEPTGDLFHYLRRRLLDSWNLPFGVLRYYDWQCRPDASLFAAGERIIKGVSWLTAMEEWPKVKASLDAGLPVALGLVKARSFDPRKLPQNHQVLAWGYDESEKEVSLYVYDPNYPGDDALTLRFDSREPDAGKRLVHSWEGGSVRGFFLTEYRKPVEKFADVRMASIL